MRIYTFKKHYLRVIFSLIALLFCQSVMSEQVNTLQGKPVFKLEIKGAGLRYFILVNGNSILEEFDPQGNMSTELTINQWMHPEQSEFSIVAAPQQGHIIKPGGTISVSLIIKDADNANIKYRLPLLELDTSLINAKKETQLSAKMGNYHLGEGNQVEFGSGEIDLGKITKVDYKAYQGAFVYSRKVSIPNSLPLWAFFNSDLLPNFLKLPEADLDSSIQNLFVEYKKVQDALASGDIDSIMPMFKERNHEGDLAFYYPPGTMEEMLRAAMLDDIDNPDWEIHIRKANQVTILRQLNERTVSLLAAKQGNILGFVNKNDGRYNSYPMMFRRENGKWILTR